VATTSPSPDDTASAVATESATAVSVPVGANGFVVAASLATTSHTLHTDLTRQLRSFILRQVDTPNCLVPLHPVIWRQRGNIVTWE